ncbi:rhodanese-like domain-containing protein, partial [Cellulomonas citrea]|uniref:rhodanese-like domain-containing protein n=1 Tax=Cellulomonas citrea TaxID=1909423 RepID=UPI001358D311
MSYAGDLTPAQAYELLTSTDALLVDVRTPDEWQHIGVPDVPGTAFVPWVLVPGSPPNPDFVAQVQAAGAAGRAVVALCRSGQRSVAAATLFDRSTTRSASRKANVARLASRQSDGSATARSNVTTVPPPV